MFKQYLYEILNNLPLILSDTTEPKDISLNRVFMLIEHLLVFWVFPPILGGVFFFMPVAMFDIASKVWLGALAQHGLHLATNAFKKK